MLDGVVAAHHEGTSTIISSHHDYWSPKTKDMSCLNSHSNSKAFSVSKATKLYLFTIGDGAGSREMEGRVGCLGDVAWFRYSISERSFDDVDGL